MSKGEEPDLKILTVVFCKCSHDLFNTNRNRDDAAPRGSLLRLLTSQSALDSHDPGALRLTDGWLNTELLYDNHNKP